MLSWKVSDRVVFHSKEYRRLCNHNPPTTVVRQGAGIGSMYLGRSYWVSDAPRRWQLTNSCTDCILLARLPHQIYLCRLPYTWACCENLVASMVAISAISVNVVDGVRAGPFPHEADRRRAFEGRSFMFRATFCVGYSAEGGAGDYPPCLMRVTGPPHAFGRSSSNTLLKGNLFYHPSNRHVFAASPFFYHF